MAAPAAVAQVESPRLERVDPGTVDVHPFSISRRVLSLDMRMPNDFGTIYQIRTEEGERRFVRLAGGVAAVFPRSVYVATPGGVIADVPPGTVFHIGGLPDELAVSDEEVAQPPPSPYRVSYARDLAAIEPSAPGDDDVPAARTDLARPSIWSSEVYRQRRIAHLLRTAAQARHSELGGEEPS